jgi:molybdopterin-guanine dinucleotide biosynthesis protein A
MAKGLSQGNENTAVVLMAGGRARRFPGKLEHPIDGRAMLARCYDSLRAAGWPMYVAAASSFSRDLDAYLDAPLLIDRRPGRGPLSAFLCACAAIRAQRIFAVAADQPQLDAAVLQWIEAEWRLGDEAVVPAHDGKIEPLAALYSRRATLREGFELRRTGKGAMRDLIERIAARFVNLDSRYFHNVNRIEDVP